MKTTLTAENAVEANKLSNNYKVGSHRAGWGGNQLDSIWVFSPQNLSLQFGFKKWKSHITARPWEDRSEIVKELYSDLNVIRGPGGGWPWERPMAAWDERLAAVDGDGLVWCVLSCRVYSDVWKHPLPAALWLVALAALRPGGCRNVCHRCGGSLW